METWLWIVLAVIVIALVIAAAMAGMRKQRTRNVDKAESIREEAAEDATVLAQRESKADELAARARAAEAEADAKAAEASRLAATAERQQASLADERTSLDERLQQADEVDPRVSDPAAPDEGVRRRGSE